MGETDDEGGPEKIIANDLLTYEYKAAKQNRQAEHLADYAAKRIIQTLADNGWEIVKRGAIRETG